MRKFLFGTFLLSAGMLAHGVAKDAAYYNQRIGRGVNMGNMLELPQARNRHAHVDPSYFKLIKSAGFDSVRIPVQWNHYTDEKEPYRIDEAFAARVDDVINAALENELVVILNIHHYADLMKEPAAHRARFLAIWAQLAPRYKDYPMALYFEVMNEPSKNMTAERWNAYQREAVELIRKTNPTRPILIAPIGWNRIDKLAALEIPESKNLIASVHYYSPFNFTHQGASWVHTDIPLGTPWMGSDKERAAIEADFAVAAAWSKQHGIPVHLGEFGAYGKADMASRIRWTAAVREVAEHNDIPWSYWEFNSGFGVRDEKSGAWREGLLHALIPAE